MKIFIWYIFTPLILNIIFFYVQYQTPEYRTHLTIKSFIVYYLVSIVIFVVCDFLFDWLPKKIKDRKFK
ncbi:hypothetical protein EGW76_14885 [Enterococcus gallinarum]|nr:hypothetical protein EGW76_14885 [Enterococcus gallinarum]